MSIPFIAGFQIIEASYLTVPKEEVILRSWKERLLSWPWKPWEKEKTVTTMVPDEKIYKTGNQIICHPAIAQQLKDTLIRYEAAGKPSVWDLI